MTVNNIRLILLMFILPFLLTCGKKNLALISEGEELINLTPITYDKNNNISPSCNSDGTQILFTSKDGNLFNIFLKITPFQGKSIKRTNFYSTDIHPCFSNDGKRFCYSSNRYGNFDLFILDSRSGFLARRITSTEEDDIFPSWSPDDKEIIFSRFDKIKKEWRIIIKNLESPFDSNITEGLNPIFQLMAKVFIIEKILTNIFLYGNMTG